MKLAIIADPHLSFQTHNHYGVELGMTGAVLRAVVDDVNLRRPDLVVWLGDVTHDGTADIRAEFMRIHGGLIGPDLIMLGNHDIDLASRAEVARQIPYTRRARLIADKWEIVLVDTVRELAPDNPSGQLLDEDRAFLKQIADDSAGPLLVLGHHPLGRGDMDWDVFAESVAGYAGTGIYIGGHSHRDWYEQKGNWHLLEVASCMTPPSGYRWLELEPRTLTLTAISVPTIGMPGAVLPPSRRIALGSTRS